MYSFPLGVILHSFRLPFREAVEKAASLGVQGLQMAFDVNTQTPEKVREELDIIKSNGLKVTAVMGDFGRGFWNEELNPETIDLSKRVMDLTLHYETNIVTSHIGVVPINPNTKRYEVMQIACRELAAYADSLGGYFAMETGPEPSIVLKTFLDSLGSRGVAVNFDPANLRMVTGEDPVIAVHNLKDYIVHTHAKDGRMLSFLDPEVVYGLRPIGEKDPKVQAFIETPLGEGQVDFKAWITALEEVGYRGYLTIEREVGEDPAADIATAVAHLRGILNG